MANEQAQAAPTTTTTPTQTPTGGGGSSSSQSSSGRGVQLKQSLRGLDFASQEAALAPVQAKGPADGAPILDTMAGGNAAGAVQRRAVQRAAAPLSTQGVSGAESATVDARR